MATNSSDMGDSQTTTSSASGATIDWTAAFQSPEFLSGLQAAIAGVTTSNPRSEQLEQLGDSIPSQPSSSGMSAAGNLPAAQGTFHAPSFVSTVDGSVPEPSCPLNTSQQPVNELNTTSVTSLASLASVSRRRSAWVLVGPQSHLNSSGKSFPTSLLTPENLDDPLSDTTSENSTIVPVSDLDILSWVECFNSYISVIATHRPHRARDLLAYMALIIRTATRFGGKAGSTTIAHPAGKPKLIKCKIGALCAQICTTSIRRRLLACLMRNFILIASPQSRCRVTKHSTQAIPNSAYLGTVMYLSEGDL